MPSHRSALRPRLWTLPLVLGALTTVSGCSPRPSDPVPPQPSETRSPAAAASDTTRIRVVVGDRTFTAVLDDTPTARDLAARLPLTLTLDDLHGLEKTGRLPQALTTDGAPRGTDPEVGDLGYYAPGQDLVLYYGDVGYFAGIVRLGHFDTSLDPLRDEEDGFTARVELDR